MSILDSILTKKQKEAGFYVVGWDIYSLDVTARRIGLLRDTKILATYSYNDVPFDQIRYDAQQILEWDVSGISFERV